MPKRFIRSGETAGAGRTPGDPLEWRKRLMSLRSKFLPRTLGMATQRLFDEVDEYLCVERWFGCEIRF